MNWPAEARPETGRSEKSQRSQSSVAASSRRSVISTQTNSRPPTGYFRAPRPVMIHDYSTSSGLVGAGGRVRSEPVPGREVWMLGRGGGQQSSFDSCLVQKGAHGHNHPEPTHARCACLVAFAVLFRGLAN